MRKIIVVFCVVLALLSAGVLGLTAYGSASLPDIYYTTDGRVALGSSIYEARPVNAERAAEAFASSQQQQTLSASYSVKLLRLFPVKTVQVNLTERKHLAVGGELIGVKLKTKGVLVVKTEAFQNESGGQADPAAVAGIKKGDTLTAVDGKPLETCEALTSAIEHSGGKAITVTGERGGETLSWTLTPQKTAATGAYKGGLWVRDSTVGVGTLTYVDLETGELAALGHGIYDADTNSMLTVSDGEICEATVSSVKKGAPGAPGEITGMLGINNFGTVTANREEGVFGTLSYLNGTPEIYPVATASEVHTGSAQVICTVADGEKRSYEVEIKKCGDTDGTKNMTVRITDQTLLSLTGGIIQGMSGSPIIQDGMLVGAVTHVFVNDPKCGYAIYAENMLQSDNK